MNVSPLTVHRSFQVEADARDGRFTRTYLPSNGDAAAWNRGADGSLYGQVIRPGVENMADVFWPAPGAPGNPDPANRYSDIDGNADQDDALAWGFAARWWLNYCTNLYEQACAPPTSLFKTGWPKNGPADPRFAPGRSFVYRSPLTGVDEPGRLGGSQGLDGMVVLTTSWPVYFAALKAQILIKALAGRVVDLVKIQIVLKHCALLLHNTLDPDADLRRFLVTDKEVRIG